MTDILSPSDYYASCKGQTRFMRDINGPFEDKLAKGERKRLKRCEAEGYYTDYASLAAAYPIIAENRAAKGRAYGMTLDECYRLPVLCFGVYPGPIAAAICVRPLPDTLYVSAWGDVPSQQKRSPVVLIAKGIYNHCMTRGVRYLDIGTADEPGLIAFKQRLGFEARIL